MLVSTSKDDTGMSSVEPSDIVSIKRLSSTTPLETVVLVSVLVSIAKAVTSASKVELSSKVIVRVFPLKAIPVTGLPLILVST